jgi:hypothetical protein
MLAAVFVGAVVACILDADAVGVGLVGIVATVALGLVAVAPTYQLLMNAFGRTGSALCVYS